MIFFFVIILLTVSNHVISDYILLYALNFLLLLVYQIYILIKEKSLFRLVLVWNFAFIYLVIFEGILNFEVIANEVGEVNTLLASKFLINANWMVIAGYALLSKKQAYIPEATINTYSPTSFTIFLIVALLGFFIFTNISIAIQAFVGGRYSIDLGEQTSFNVISSGLSRASGFILPTIIAYYLKYVKKSEKALLYSLIMSAPIILLLFMRGSRFALLFSIGGLLVVNFLSQKFSTKQISYIVIVGLSLLYLTTLMKKIRVYGFEGTQAKTETVLKPKSTLRDSYSSEDVVLSTTKLVDYFNSEDYYLGRSSSTFLIFWIPRAIWNDKPTFLGHWFIRKYKGGIIGLGSGHSISFTFAGDAYVDFGPYFGAYFCIIFGLIIGRMEKLNIEMSQSGNVDIRVIIVAMFYPFCFFGVRSINTALFTLIGTYIIYYLFKETLEKDDTTLQ